MQPGRSKADDMTYTHPHMKVARMEVAVEALGMRITKLVAAIEDEHHDTRPSRDRGDAGSTGGAARSARRPLRK